MSSWKRWLVYSSGASASFWGFRGWCSASLDAAVRAGIITILAQVTIINVIHQCQTDYHKFTMTKLTKKSRYFNINQKFDIDRNRQTFGFLSQSISCRAAPPLQERKSRLSTKQLRCLASLFCTTSLPPTQHFEMSHKWKDSILAKHLLHIWHNTRIVCSSNGWVKWTWLKAGQKQNSLVNSKTKDQFWEFANWSVSGLDDISNSSHHPLIIITRLAICKRDVWEGLNPRGSTPLPNRLLCKSLLFQNTTNCA